MVARMLVAVMAGVVPLPGALTAQEPDALAEAAEQLAALLTSYGQVRVTGSDGMPIATWEIRDVSLNECVLRWTGSVKITGPTYTTREEKYVLPLAVLDVAAVRVRRWEPTSGGPLVSPEPAGSRRTQYQVALPPPKQVREVTASYPPGIPIDTRKNAERVATALQDVARLCGES